MHLGHFLLVFLPPANEVCEGYDFTGVCLSTGGSLSRGGSVRETPHTVMSRWYTSYWNAFLFCQIWLQGNFWHILGPILVIFEICDFLMIPGTFEFSWWRSGNYPLIGLVLGGQVPRLHHGTIWFAIQHTYGGCCMPLKVEYHFFNTFMKEGLKHHYYWGIASRISL